MTNINNTLVSIIMPSYNSALTISESIDSILIQSYENWELLIIDDHSSDTSIEVINCYIKDPRIKLLKNHFLKGAAGARRTGIELSNGRYIAFLDSDDVWHSTKLEMQIEFMMKNNFAFTYTNYSTFKRDIIQVNKKVKSPKFINYNTLIKCCNIGCLTVVLDKNKFENFEYGHHPKEDYAFWLKLLKQIECGYNLNIDLAYYRISDNSLSSKKFNELFKQWHVIRHVEQNSLIKSIYCILHYSFNGLIKHS